jgi:formylglycine-generating enzyme required for sulfatase activity
MHKHRYLDFLVILMLGCCICFSQQADKLAFVPIPAGEFMMGSENGDQDEKPVHRVRFSQGFEMMEYEVTQEQWTAVMGKNPSHFKDCGPRCPVETVSYAEVQAFVSKLNSRGDGWRYRLPTEAEWEYAARAGSTGDYAGKLDSMGWYKENSGGKTHPVGQKQPNAWGLYDMHGNVWEWVQDWYGDYPREAVTDPTGPASGSSRVVRGGGWSGADWRCRSADRDWLDSGRRYNLHGFRLVRTKGGTSGEKEKGDLVTRH